MRNWAYFMRTLRGQFCLIGALYLGALVLAVVAICLRTVFFEGFVREKYAEATERSTDLLKEVADRGRCQELSKKELENLYGAILRENQPDERRPIVRTLFDTQGEFLLERIRRTLAAGNPEQRRTALTLLEECPLDLRDKARTLCDYAQIRARHRGEPEQAAHAAIVLRSWEQP